MARNKTQNMYCPITVTFADWNSALRSRVFDAELESLISVVSGNVVIYIKRVPI
jgi:hypothetical protein